MLLVNTDYLREDGKRWSEKGYYTKAPKGSAEYIEYWKEQTRRCFHGYSVGDVYITGRYYFYLNFCPIERIPDEVLKSKNKISASVDKILATPGFWEIDYAWYNAKHEAMSREFRHGNHLACAKTRGAGFSYKEAADGLWNFNFIPKSKSFYLASTKEYLTKDGIINKVDLMMNHINSFTAWSKHRQVKNDQMHRKASYLQGEDEKGFLSEVLGVVVDNPNKARGKRGKKITFEEAGSFKDLLLAWQICKESVEQGGYLAGQMSAFGTGGEDGAEIEGLQDLFDNPLAYNILPFENHWEETEFHNTGVGDFAPSGLTDQSLVENVNSEEANILFKPKHVYNKCVPKDFKGETCGFFVPAYMANDKYMDDNGNVDIASSIDFEIDARKTILSSNDHKAVDRKTAERPFKPSEVFKRLTGNPLPRVQAEAQLARIRRSRDIQSLIKHGTLARNDAKKVVFNPAVNVKPLNYFPHKNNDNLEGCVTVYDYPFLHEGAIPEDLYFITVDPFYKDDADDRTSLGACYVWMKPAKFTKRYGNRMVASFIGRPKLNTFYDQLFLLSEFYGWAKIQSEISGGGKGILDAARQRRLTGILEAQPLMQFSKELAVSPKNRSIFMNVSTDEKRLGIEYFASWLLEEVSLSPEGVHIRNIDTIFDEGLLEEIIKFKPDPKFNADRISSCVIAIFMFHEYRDIIIQEKRKFRSKNSIFSRELYTDEPRGSSFNTMEDGMFIF